MRGSEHKVLLRPGGIRASRWQNRNPCKQAGCSQHAQHMAGTDKKESIACEHQHGSATDSPHSPPYTHTHTLPRETLHEQLQETPKS